MPCSEFGNETVSLRPLVVSSLPDEPSGKALKLSSSGSDSDLQVAEGRFKLLSIC